MNLLRGNGKNLLGWLVALAVLAIASQASAYRLKPLYDFCAQQQCADGAAPIGTLLRDQSGNLFGTSLYGGTGQGPFGHTGAGTVFELSPNAHGGWRERVLHSFCLETNCADGSWVNGQLIMDTAGILYGTARGDSEPCVDYGPCGLVYELIPNTKRTKWKFKIVYQFCHKARCRDGALPISGLNYAGAASGAPYDGVSPLYVVTGAGGPHGNGGLVPGNGTILELVPGKPRWRASVIHYYGHISGRDEGPTSNLFVDESGSVYGAGTSFVYQGRGSIFELTPGIHRLWTTTTLQRFCVRHQEECQRGGEPYAPSVRGADGSFFGVTHEGGKRNCIDWAPNCGVLYKLVRDGGQTREKVLYDFCSESKCTDGAAPNPQLSMDSAGNLFGTAAHGGQAKSGCKKPQTCPGVVFRFGKDGYHVLYGFCSESHCTDGKTPSGGVILDAAGDLFGVTFSEGLYGQGGIYELIP